MTARIVVGLTLCGLLLGGCATRAPDRLPEPGRIPEPAPVEVRAEPLSEKGNHSPYRVLGETYVVLPTSYGYVERGTASWYGQQFHGRLTSNQEVFDMYQLTAAHKTLPLPTYARVTNLDNGKSVVVRVNDRGPFKKGRIIDLSFAAARALDMIERGTAPVEVEALVPEGTELSRPLVQSAEHLYLQVGAYAQRENALAMMQQLRAVDLPPAQVFSERAGAGVVHRVKIGPLASAEHADELIARLMLLGMDRPVVIFR